MWGVRMIEIILSALITAILGWIVFGVLARKKKSNKTRAEMLHDDNYKHEHAHRH